MSRRSSSRQQAAAAASLEKKSSLPPNVERGLFSLVEGNERIVASMLSIDIKTLGLGYHNGSNDNENDNNLRLTTSLQSSLSDCMRINNLSSMIDCMQTNQLSVEAFLTRFFDISVLRNYCIQRLNNVSGKGNTATLAARIGRIWSTQTDFELVPLAVGDKKKHPTKDGDAVVGDASGEKKRAKGGGTTAQKKSQSRKLNM
eukprot:CAMPEP_0171041490 /NCGR_PEP_ID=MMETSP0736-20130129/45582_1 /TAXON_ID=186038 /ORGANISM="Fragilariopsis kerguelensis, Strain L26-C5" /LENGTH=200 /DNA_ID=CAMNT_0011489573 /DNA_START=21 /DNA_END=623 /DNA_ORIENTATION=-